MKYRISQIILSLAVIFALSIATVIAGPSPTPSTTSTASKPKSSPSPTSSSTRTPASTPASTPIRTPVNAPPTTKDGTAVADDFGAAEALRKSKEARADVPSEEDISREQSTCESEKQTLKTRAETAEGKIAAAEKEASDARGVVAETRQNEIPDLKRKIDNETEAKDRYKKELGELKEAKGKLDKAYAERGKLLKGVTEELNLQTEATNRLKKGRPKVTTPAPAPLPTP